MLHAPIPPLATLAALVVEDLDDNEGTDFEDALPRLIGHTTVIRYAVQMATGSQEDRERAMLDWRAAMQGAAEQWLKKNPKVARCWLAR